MGMQSKGYYKTKLNLNTSTYKPQWTRKNLPTFWKTLYFWIKGFTISWEHAMRNAINVGMKVEWSNGSVDTIIDCPSETSVIMKGVFK